MMIIMHRKMKISGWKEGVVDFKVLLRNFAGLTGNNYRSLHQNSRCLDRKSNLLQVWPLRLFQTSWVCLKVRGPSLPCCKLLQNYNFTCCVKITLRDTFPNSIRAINYENRIHETGSRYVEIENA
jgi:hypothetical protein